MVVTFVNKEAAAEFQTDLRRWRLTFENGRQIWKYDENQDPQTFNEKYWLGLPVDIPKMPQLALPIQTLENGWEFLKRLQTERGNWGTNCDGPLFVMSGIVISMYILGFPIEYHAKLEMCRYLINIANDDGGWGTSIDNPSTVFGTTVNYITLRMLGMSAEHSVCVKARTLLSTMGSPLALPSWGKFWLCLLGLYEWDGMIPLLPEPLLAPQCLPLNPGNWWMPARNLYISMSYLYGHRFTIREDALIAEIRTEIYDIPYCEVTWKSQRSNISEVDRLRPQTSFQSVTAFTLGLFEQWKVPFFRRRALNEALFQIEAEVHNTKYICLTPVTWATNILALWHAHGPDSHWVRGMKDRFNDSLWMCREGLGASGTDGTAVWDTSLSVQAICGTGFELRPGDVDVLARALEFLDSCQIRDDPLGMEHVYRHPSKGGWPFSTRDQGYVASDTTAEALSAILRIQKLDCVPKRISTGRLEEAINLLLGLESSGGGYAAFEKVRGPRFLELFNITDMYESCMVESRYPECTASVMMAMAEFTAEYPAYRFEDIRRCIERSESYLLHSQYPNGSWLGSWGVCFTYATMFALQGLACVGRSEQSCAAVRKSCAFLCSTQNADGGWGESVESAKVKDYVPEPKGSQVHNTAFAVIGLIAAQCSDQVSIERGVRYIMKTQQVAGDWLPGTVEGIYAPPSGYRYPLYKFHFTLKALGQYMKRYGISKTLD